MRYANAIEECLKQILSEAVYVPSPQATRRKDGTRVWRITGSGMRRWKDGKILCDSRHGEEPIEVTRANWKDDIPGYYIYEWEFLLLERGQEQVEQLLRNALAEKGIAADVHIGKRNGGSAYDTSIAVVPLSKPRDNDIAPNKALLAELASIVGDLATIATTIDALVVRLRSQVARANTQNLEPMP